VAINDPRKAVALLSTTPVDLVVCDFMMPGMTGQEVYVAALALRPELRERFLMMTGGAFSARGQEFLATADIPVIKKPFAITELRTMVRARLGLPAE
jgi:CheY-like chemotaxis protein